MRNNISVVLIKPIGEVKSGNLILELIVKVNNYNT
jgi:hypothetical protein